VTGRAVAPTSHFHEGQQRLQFDRRPPGQRLDIPRRHSDPVERGTTGGCIWSLPAARTVYGFRRPGERSARLNLLAQPFQPPNLPPPTPFPNRPYASRMDRRAYANLWPHHRRTGCALADTEVILEVEKDFTTLRGR